MNIEEILKKEMKALTDSTLQRLMTATRGNFGSTALKVRRMVTMEMSFRTLLVLQKIGNPFHG